MNFRNTPDPVAAAKLSHAQAFREWKPVHPLLRAISLLLVLALTLTGPVVPVAVAADVPNNVYINDPDASSIVDDSGNPIISLPSGSLNNSIVIQQGATMSAKTLTVSLASGSALALGLSFVQSGDKPLFGGLTVNANTLQLSLGSGGLNISSAIKLVSQPRYDSNGSAYPSEPGLWVKLASSSQTWNISGGNVDAVDINDPTLPATSYQGVAQLGDSFNPVRVDSADSAKKNLILNLVSDLSAKDNYGDPAVAQAFLDPGANIDLEKNGNGVLTLTVFSPFSTLSPFNGTVSVNSGTVVIYPQFFLKPGASQLGPQIKFNYQLPKFKDDGTIEGGDSTVGFVEINGSNFVSGITGGVGVIYSGAQDGELTIDAASGTTLSVSNAFKNNSVKGDLSLRKTGGGVLEINPSTYESKSYNVLDLTSDYSGGTFLEQGSLRITYGSKVSDNLVAAGPLGKGKLVFLGGTLNIGVSGGTLLHNDIDFGLSDQGETGQIKATINGGSLSIAAIASEYRGNVTLNADTVLVVDSPVTVDKDIFSGSETSLFTLVKDGKAALTLKSSSSATEFQHNLNLRAGTLVMQGSVFGFDSNSKFTVEADRSNEPDGSTLSRGLRVAGGTVTPFKKTTKTSGLASISLNADFNYYSTDNQDVTPGASPVDQNILNLGYSDDVLSQTTLGGGNYAYGRAVPDRVAINVESKNGVLVLGSVASNAALNLSGMEGALVAGSNTLIAAGTQFAAGMILSGYGVAGRRVMASLAMTSSELGYIGSDGSSVMVASGSGFVSGMLLKSGTNSSFVREVNVKSATISVVSATSGTLITVSDAANLEPGMRLSNVSELGVPQSAVISSIDGKTVSLDIGLTLESGTWLSAVGSRLSLSGTLSGSSLGTLTGYASSLVLDGNSTESGVKPLGGSLSRTYLGKTGLGTLEIAGTLDVPGIDITGGSLQFSNPDPVNYSGTLAVNGASTFSILGGSVEFSGTITGGASLTKVGSGKLLISHTNPLFSGSIMLSVGTLTLGAANALGNDSSPYIVLGSLTAARLQLNGYDLAPTLQLGSATDRTPVIENAGATDATLTVNGSLTYAGTLKDGGGVGKLGLRKLGAGSLVLSGISNNYTGTTTVMAGMLFVGSLNSGTILFGPLAVSDQGFAEISTKGGTLNAAVSNNGSAVGGGTSLLFSATTNTITLRSLSGSGKTVFNSNASITTGSISAGYVTVARLLTADIGGGSVDVGTLSSNLVSDGTVRAGSVTVSTFRGGAITVSSGSAILTNMNGGSLILNGPNNYITTLTDGTINIGGTSNVTVLGGTGASTGLLLGTGSFTKSGSGALSLAGASTSYTGTTTINAGSLLFTGNGSVAGPISVVNGATLYFNGTSSQTFNGALSGSGALIKAGTNLVTLGSAASFTGATTVNAGSLAFAGSFGTSALAVQLANSDASLLLTAGSYTFNGKVSGTGTTFLKGTSDASRLYLTLGPNANLGTNISIEPFATLTISSADNFAGNFTLNGGSLIISGSISSPSTKFTINSGQLDLNGFQPMVGTLVGTGGTILSTSGTAPTITADTIKLEGTTVSPPVKVIPGSIVEYIDSNDPAAGLRLISGALKNYASATGWTLATVGTSSLLLSGTYTTLETQAVESGRALRFDQAVNVSGSITARVSSGSAYTLAIEAPVSARFMDIQNGVTATFLSGGTFSAGTLQIEGTVGLETGGSLSFQKVKLMGGTLNASSNTSMSFGSLTATSGVLAAKLAGSGTITKSESGALTISGSNGGYSGSLIISEGVVNLGNSADPESGNSTALQSANVSVGSGATLRLNGYSTTLSGSLTGNGVIENGANSSVQLTLNPLQDGFLTVVIRDGDNSALLSINKAGSHSLTINANQSYTGSTTVAQGSLILGTGSLPQRNVLVTGGTLDLGGKTQIVSELKLSRGGILQNGTLVSSGSYQLVNGDVSAVLSGSGSLYMTESGTVYLRSASNYSGYTFINAGSLLVQSGATLGNGAGTVNINGGFLGLSGPSQSLSNVVLNGGTISGGSISSTSRFDLQNGAVGTALDGSAKLTKTGNESVTLSARNFYSGGTEISAGRLIMAVDNALPNGGSLKLNGGALILGETTQTAGSVNFSGGSLSGTALTATSYEFSGGVTSVKAVLQGSSAALTVNGGMAILGSNSTYGGGTNVKSGSLILDVANALPTSGSVRVEDGELSLGTYSQTVGAFTLLGGQVSGTGSLSMNAGAFELKSGTVSAVLDGNSGVTKSSSGSVKLSSVNYYKGTTQVSAGTLIAGPGALSGSDTLTIDGSGSLDAVNFKDGASLTLASTASASFSLEGGALGDVNNESSKADSLFFSAESGTITLASLSGNGRTRFASNARINGSVRAGFVTVNGLASLDTVSGGTLTLNGNSSSIATLNGGALLLGDHDTLTVLQGTSGGDISGGGSLLKAGSGQLTLSGALAYTGMTTVAGGTLDLAGVARSVGAVKVTGGSLVNGALTGTSFEMESGYVGAVLAGSGDFTKRTGGTLVLAGNNALTGKMSVFDGSLKLEQSGMLSSGELVVETLGASGTSVDLGGSHQVVGAVSLTDATIRNGTLTGRSYTLSSGTVSAELDGPATLSKVTSGSLYLSGANRTFSGSVNVSAGTLVLAGTSALGSGTLLVGSGTPNIPAVVDLGGTLQSVGVVSIRGGSLFHGSLEGTSFDAQSGYVKAGLAGSGDFTKTTGGTLILAGNNTLTGKMSVFDGSLKLEQSGTLSSGELVVGTLGASGTSVDLGGSHQFVGAVSLTDATIRNGTLTGTSYTLGSGTVSAELAGSAGLLKNTDGTLTLSGTNTYTGATTVERGTLATTVSDALKQTSAITVNGGSLYALDYNRSASLNVASLGTANIWGTGLKFTGSLTNANRAADSVFFSATTGTITLGSLYGGGSTRFASNADISSGRISDGTVIVANSLRASVQDGIVSARTLRAQSISGGSVTVDAGADVGTISDGALTVGGVATFANVEGGMIRLNGPTSSITNLTGGNITLGGASITSNSLTVTQGVSSGIIGGTGTLIKSGPGELSLTQGSASLGSGLALYVKSGTLNTGNILTDTRSISVASGGSLSMTLSEGMFIFNGSLTANSGTVALFGTGQGSQLVVGTSTERFPVLDGVFTVGNLLTLDLSRPVDNIFGDTAKLNLMGGGSLIVGSSTQEMWIQELNLDTQSTGSFNISGDGKILYDTLPAFLTEDNKVSDSRVVLSGSVSFDYLTKTVPVNIPGTYKYIAGNVRDLLKGKEGSVTDENGFLKGEVLLLEPEHDYTKIYLKRQVVNFSQEIIAMGKSDESSGTILIGTLAYTPKLTIKKGVTVSLEMPGILSVGIGDARASQIINEGNFVVVGTAGSKVISNTISGSGVLTKKGEGLLSFTGDNIHFGGVTNLNAGTFLAASTTALGTSSVNFNGGSLSFASGLGEMSLVGALSLQDADAPIDTGDNKVKLEGNIVGANTLTLTKTGTGVLVLSGTNTAYTGTFSAKEGTLQIGDGATGGAISDSSKLNVESGAIMRLARSSNTTLSQTLSGGGTFEQAGTGTTSLGGDNQSFTGAVVLKSGTLALGSALAIGTSDASQISFNGGVLQYGASNQPDYSARFDKADGQQIKVDTNSRKVTFASSLTGNTTTLAKLGAGELELSGSNSYAGATTVQSGTLRLVGAQSGNSAITVNDGRLEYQITGGNSSGAVDMTAKGSTVFSVASGAPTFSGTLSGAGSVVKEGAGTLTVTQSLLQTGGFTLNGGSFALATPAGADKTSMGGVLELNAGSLNISGGVLKLNSTLKGGSPATLQLGGDTLFLESVALNGLNLQLPEGVTKLTVFAKADPSASTFQMIGGGEVTFKSYNSKNIVASDLRGTLENPYDFGTLAFEANSNVTFRNPLALSGDFQTVTGSTISFAKDVKITGAVQLVGGTVAVTGGTLTATTAAVKIGSGTSATLQLSGDKTALVASKVELNAGSITVSSNALQTALQSVQTLEVGTSGGRPEDAQLVLGDGTGTMTLGATQTLKGSGTIRGNVTLGTLGSSMLSPGNSPGKILIDGSLDLQGGIVEIEKSLSLQDQIQINPAGKTVTVGSLASLVLVEYQNGALPVGATLDPIFEGAGAGSSLVFAPDRIFFKRIVGNTSLYSAMYTATGDANHLVIARKRFAATSGLSQNATGFAKALDIRLIDKGAINDRLLELGTGTNVAEAAASVPRQLAAGNPAAYAELAGLSKQRTLTLSQSLGGHFASLRAGLIDVSEGEYNLWTTGYGTWHKQNASAAVGSAGFSGNTYGDMFGVEKRFGNLVAGITGAIGSTSANFTALQGRVATDSWHSGAYATANVGGYALETSVVFGSTDSNAHRTISTSGMATQEGNIKMSGSEWLAHVGVAKPVISSGSLTLTPSLRLIAQGSHLDGASENKLDGLDVTTAAQSTSSVLHELGVEARRSLKIASKPASASLQLDWLHDYTSGGQALNMDLAGDSSTRFGYKGSDAGSDALRFGASVETAITRRTTLRISLDYQAQSKASTTHSSISLGYTF